MNGPLRSPIHPLPPGSSGDRTCHAFEQALQEGLKALESGHYVDDADVWAWVDSWDSGDELPMPQPRKHDSRGP